MVVDFTTFINEVKKVSLSGSLVMKDRMKMKKLLRENILIFKFQKRDGTIRKAVGTLYPDLLPPIKGTGGPKPVYQMVYYDLEKMEWRSFRSFKFIKIVKTTPITEDIVDDYKKRIEDEERRRKEERKRHAIHTEREERREHEEEKHEEDIKKKTFKAGEKIPEDELMRRSVDTRKGTRKNDTTKKANDKFKKEQEEKKHETEHKEHEHKHEEHHEDEHKEHKEEHHEEKHDHHEEHNDDGEKSFKKGDKIPEKELMRRSVDLRKGSRKNKFTKKANDSFKKGELED